MGVFDRFKGGGGRDDGREGGGRGSRTGRSGARGERGERSGGRRPRVEDRTEPLKVPPSQRPAPSPDRPAPSRPSGASRSGHAPTEVHPVPPSGPDAGRTAPAPDRPPSPPRVPPAPRPTPSDAEKTRIVGKVQQSKGIIGVLVAVEGELQGQAFVLPDKGHDEILVGRLSSCDVCIPSEWISRSHAKIVAVGGQFMVGPLSEDNPTLVNDTATQGTELKDGDSLRLGKTTLRFRTV